MINSGKEWDFMDDKKKKKNDVAIKIGTRIGCFGIIISAIMFIIVFIEISIRIWNH